MKSNEDLKEAIQEKNEESKNEAKTIALVVATIIAIIGRWGINWLCTCGIIKLITLWFDVTFKWSVATAIWFLLCILNKLCSAFLNSGK